MNVKTRHFGDVEVEDSKIITMDNGLFGFENYKKYVLLRHPFLSLLGCGSDDVRGFASSYLIITVGIGGLGTALSMMTAHLFRGEGRSLKEACKLAAADSGFGKNELYELSLQA